MEFLQTAQRLTLPHQPCNLKPTPIDPEISRGMNPKKRHEVVNLSALITDVCSKNHLHNVVDVGGGLVCKMDMHDCYKLRNITLSRHNSVVSFTHCWIVEQ